jgi:hypothetical protein
MPPGTPEHAVEGTVAPGLIDCHLHLLWSGLKLLRIAGEDPLTATAALAALRSEPFAAPWIDGELWELPAAALGPFLAALGRPMMLGRVTLADGRSVVGFGSEAAAVDGAPDISDAGSWPAYVSRTPTSS